VCYKAFDHFRFKPDISNISIQQLLQLPLHYLLHTTPANHWTQRHKTFPADLFFMYDQTTRRLRLKIDGEYDIKPRLCKTLKEQILIQRTVRIQPFLWRFITSDISVEEYERTDDLLKEQFRSLPSWHKYDKSRYRQYKNKIRSISLIPAKDFKRFWSTSMTLAACSLWYRLISKKIPTAVFSHKIGRADSTLCQLCHLHYDSFEHFLVLCPPKYSIWSTILMTHFPLHSVTPNQLWSFLLNLHYPDTLPPSLYMLFYSIMSTTQWCIWKSYWQYVIDNVPFHQDGILNNINQYLSILNPPDKLL
jgi:hypothetical protein